LKRILYIEDNIEIGDWVKRDLTDRGYNVTWLKTGEKIMTAFPLADVVVLDIMLPGLDGFTIGKRLKQKSQQIPILILSARTAIDDKLQGLAFADDYMVKPFHPDELAARIDVLLRRFGPEENNVLNLRHLQINPHTSQITDSRTGHELIFTGKQYQIFMYLIKNSNQILTKEQIYEAVWGESYIEGDKTLMVHIRHIREKIEKDPSHPTIIETIRGLGYRVKR
jgi:DNA-binding response OmpR family regulator